MQDFLLMNAAGTCKTLPDVEKLVRAPIHEITIGSITLEPRSGNSGNVFWPHESGTSLNSLGLPNGGVAYYNRHLPMIKDIVWKNGKRLRVSISPFSEMDIPSLVKCAAKGHADELEVNLSCPNVWNGQSQKQMTGFDPKSSARCLARTLEEVATWGHAKRVWAKVPPYSDPFQLENMAEIIRNLDLIYPQRIGVVACNAFPNAYALENGKPVITPGGGLAGLGGMAMKHISLGQVVQFRSCLPKHIPVIRAGGVSTGNDLHDSFAVGAVGAQVNTAYSHGENPRVFSDLLEEYARDLEPA